MRSPIVSPLHILIYQLFKKNHPLVGRTTVFRDRSPSLPSKYTGKSLFLSIGKCNSCVNDAYSSQVVIEVNTPYATLCYWHCGACHHSYQYIFIEQSSLYLHVEFKHWFVEYIIRTCNLNQLRAKVFGDGVLERKDVMLGSQDRSPCCSQKTQILSAFIVGLYHPP